MGTDKIEAVKKMSETLNKESMNPAEEMERMASNKEHFQSLIDSTQPLKPTSFERIDPKAFTAEEIQSIETKPALGDENVTAQKSGSATDQEGRRRRQPETEEVEGVAATGSKKPATSKSLMDEVGKIHTNVSHLSKLSPEALKTQAKEVIGQIDQVKSQLAQTKTTDIKPSYQTLLRNRLSHIDDNLKIALSKAGVEYTPPPSTPAGGKPNPVDRFVGFLTNSQHQLETLHGTIENLNITGAQLSPVNMLAIQMKMGYVQQQIELFTSLLNKALESTKTIMNVQV